MDLRGLDKEWRGFSDCDITKAKSVVSPRDLGQSGVEDTSQGEHAITTTPNMAPTPGRGDREGGVEGASPAQLEEQVRNPEPAEVEIRER